MPEWTNICQLLGCIWMWRMTWGPISNYPERPFMAFWASCVRGGIMDGGQHSKCCFLFIGWHNGVSYRVAARAFDVPKSTVCRIVHRVAFDIRRCKANVISFPTANMLGDIGRAFGQLAQHDAFNNAVGAIDGCHIGIKPPKHNQ